MDHTAHTQAPTASQPAVREGGQAAFAAIQEIVARLLGDPDTDWSQVNVEALRQHLMDMDNVTLRSQVTTERVEDGARFAVTSDNSKVTTSIRKMVSAHVATMNVVKGWHFQVNEVPGGVNLTVTGAPKRIRALGFIGIMTVGAHHQAHHLTLASGQDPHGH